MDRAEELLDKANRRVPMTQREIAELIRLAGVSISRARVFQLHERAIAKLRKRADLLETAKQY
jgi:hypothetical protein